MDAWNIYQKASEKQHEHEKFVLGSPSSFSLLRDPKHLLFVLSRYKFVAKVLSGKESVAEIGSGDGIGLPLVAKEVTTVTTFDWDATHIGDLQTRVSPWITNASFNVQDLTKGSLPSRKFDAVYSIDVIEHVDPRQEKEFLKNAISGLKEDGLFITGTPNKAAEAYQSPQSAEQHINLHSFDSLRELHKIYFKNVLMFGMNDEVLHTGFGPMCHYLWAIGIQPR